MDVSPDYTELDGNIMNNNDNMTNECCDGEDYNFDGPAEGGDGSDAGRMDVKEEKVVADDVADFNMMPVSKDYVSITLLSSIWDVCYH